MIIVLTTVPPDKVENLAVAILESRLAACVQVLPEMTSFYVWEGKLHKDPEQLVLIKTTEDRSAELERFIIENHSYDVPEIVSIKADKVSDAYLKWVTESVSR